MRACLGDRRRRAAEGRSVVRQEPNAVDAGGIGEDRRRTGGGKDPAGRPVRSPKQALGGFTGRAAALAMLLPLAGCLSILSDIAPAPPRETSDHAFSQENALEQVNAFRTANGLAALQTSPQLVAAAEAQSRAMAEKDRMDHYVSGPLPTRIKTFGYSFATAGENIARGQTDFAAAMTGWERSPGHRRNLLDPKFTEAGFAAVAEKTSGRIYWTQIFGRPREGAPDALVGADGSPVMTFGGLRVPSR